MTTYVEIKTEEEYTSRELAWFKVFDLCLELGMNTDTNKTGVQDVLDFIKDLTKHKPQ